MIKNKIPIDVLREIIVSEMSLEGKRVMIWNNKSGIPKDEALFITLEFGSSKAFSNIVEAEARTDGFYEVQSLSMLENYVIEILSRDLSALRRKEEVLLALRSTYSNDKQVENAMMISRIGSLQDLSEVEATARLFRFQCTATIQASYVKEKIINYYETFPTLVKKEDEEVNFTLPLS